MFSFLGRLVIARPYAICASWLAIAVLLSLIAPAWDTKVQDDDIRFLPERCGSVRAYRLLEKAFPREVFASQAVFAVERTGSRLTAADFLLVDQLTADLRQLGREEPGLQIGRIYSHRDLAIGQRLTSADGRCTLIQVALGAPFLADQTRLTMNRAESRLRQRLASTGADAPQLFVTGSAGVGRDMNQACAESLDGTTLATIVLVLVILVAVYRSPLLALVPLVTIAVSVVVSLKVLALATLIPGIHLVNITKVFAIVILYGAGTDYCLFLISRYQEELEAGQDGATAIRRSVKRVGTALAASAGTVMCGLGLMVVAEFAKVRYAGLAIALGLGVALAASLTLGPALLHMMGTRVFWPRGVPRFRTIETAAVGAASFWNRVSRIVVARPVLVWCAAFLALVPLTLLGLGVQSDYRATAELPPSSSSVKGLTAIQRHFTAGEIGPVTVLLSAPWNWDSQEGLRIIEHVGRSFACLDNVAEVRSLTRPLGQPLAMGNASDRPKGLAGRRWNVLQPAVQVVRSGARKAALDHYLARVADKGGNRSVTRLDVVLKSDPFEPASAATLDVIQAYLRKELPQVAAGARGVQAECTGVTVNARDLEAVTRADRVRVNVLMLAGIFVILLMLVRQPWLAAYLLVTVLFSYFATLGVTMLAGGLWSGRPLDVVDWRVPFFLFIILVAVGQDYNILLVSRALQERNRYGVTEGIRRALARTGGTITSCGLIMAGTFATLMLAGLGTLKQIGFALAFGVLLDTLVVRPFLVPAFILVVGRLGRARAETVAWSKVPVPAGLRRAG
jgi:RND superfamily putative drug exporter